MISGDFSGMKSFLTSYGCQKFRSSGDGIMCTCPFHSERKPSFGVKVDRYGNGCFHCFACGEKGSIDTLIARLSGPTASKQEIKKHLTMGAPASSSKQKKLIQPDFSEEMLQCFNHQCAYWPERGIWPQTIEGFKLGLSLNDWSVTIPQRSIVDPGRLVGVCLRLWDTAAGFPSCLKMKLMRGEIRKYTHLPGSIPSASLFGVEAITSLDEVYLFEGAIDAMNFMQVTGCQALARWGTGFHLNQAGYLRRFKRVNVVVDNDGHGLGKLSALPVYRLLAPHTEVRIYDIPLPVKDYSEAVVQGYQNIPLQEVTIESIRNQKGG